MGTGRESRDGLYLFAKDTSLWVCTPRMEAKRDRPVRYRTTILCLSLLNRTKTRRLRSKEDQVDHSLQRIGFTLSRIPKHRTTTSPVWTRNPLNPSERPESSKHVTPVNGTLQRHFYCIQLSSQDVDQSTSVVEVALGGCRSTCGHLCPLVLSDSGVGSMEM